MSLNYFVRFSEFRNFAAAQVAPQLAAELVAQQLLRAQARAKSEAYQRCGKFEKARTCG
jgi:hypothetical protein